MKALQICFSLLFLSPVLHSQVNYDDVAVIINDNSPISISVGNYFQSQRSIPNQNIIHITAPTIEIIDSAAFEALRVQIESYLTTNNLTDSINYIVTTKGVPLKVDRTNCSYQAGAGPFNCTTVESELTLILSGETNSIGSSSPTINTYYGDSAHFSRSIYDMYLVTRLDGYTENDIFSLIDRSGPSTPVNKISNNFVFDISHVPPGDAAFYDSYMSQSILSVQNSGWNTIYHPDTTRLYDQENVLGYTSVTYVASTTPLNYSWVPGSFAEIMNSQSDEIFNNTAPTADQSLADLISEGLTGGHTYGHPAFFSLILDYKILFDRYTDTLAEFNLAESYYMATKRLSAQDIIIGDPKTSLVIDNVASLGTIESINILIGPNPSFGVLNIDPNGVNIESIEVLNNVGQRVFSSEHKVASKFQLDLSELSKGTYFLHLTTDQGDYRESIILLD